jgi:excisionase family DNA binding protein
MTQKKTSLQQFRQALDDLRQALEGMESALIKFEEETLEEGAGEGARCPQSSGTTAFQLLSIPEVCQKLGMGKSWVYRRIKSGEIPSIKLGHNIKIKREDLEGYLESQRYQPSSEQD